LKLQPVKRIAILTPDMNDPAFAGRWSEVLETACAPLREAGLEVEHRSWTSAGDLTRFDLVLPLLVWGYPRAVGHWVAQVSAWEGTGVRLCNPPSVLCWNSDKNYLAMLAARGAPVIPTLYVERLDEAALAAAAERLQSEILVAKPQVSSSAWQTIRWSAGVAISDGPAGAAMIQPYLAEIEKEGEISLFYFSGAFSHAIRKLPRPGDFRVQPEYEGVISRHEPARDERAAAEAILAAVEETLLYARIDLVRGPTGAPLLIELELIEPDLYLDFDPRKGERFASAVTAALAPVA
jgi:glutathione synthase/RimK-type ligase-like ATP-grasp enzyme